MNNGLFANPKITPTSFTSAEIAVVSSSATITVNHGLGAQPRRVRWVLVCKTAEQGYSVGDELDVTSVREISSAGIHASIGANVRQAFLVLNSSSGWQLFNFGTSANASLTNANWRFKCYCDLN